MNILFKSFKFINVVFLSFYVIAHAKENEQAFLWQVQNKHITVYLAGSIHALNERHYPLPQAYLDAYQKSDNLVVELNVNKLDPYISQSLIQSKMWLPVNQTLEKYLSKNALDALKHFNIRNKSEYEKLIRMRPWMVIEQLTGYQLKQTQFKADLGLDQYFLQMAEKNNKPILELETLEQQITAIADSPFHSQIAALEVSLSQLDDKDYLEKMVNYWERADPVGLYNFVYQDVVQNPKLGPMMKSLLDDRNKSMADVIALYLNQPISRRNNYFVVVGALHLTGPNSIQKQLERKGYFVQPLFKKESIN
ncbi:TraB/GumN family protein [Marinomonas algicola]|uniref:TraB/GumN family protein n=1 Tax=Marinomonas algicola TaxID=2773454 RepID=UPI00174D94B5|nr:TraB/GumN family protein [Marinomonas algicola]